MNIAQDRLKSTSHTALHNMFKSQSSGFPATSTALNVQLSQQKHPLRNIRQNSTILRSPGPLASMLKTTTETGDIRAFSIQASNLPPKYHQSPSSRPRFNHGDADFAAKLASVQLDNYYGPENGRRLRNYRDTASEIISLYGYDNQAYFSRANSPMLEDNSPRSYSIRTCSSRKMSSQKSSGTLHSHSSGSGLQRPRSPFPYPTRLKRPGVRPASPAMAESGYIDYSKMVELDRVSQVSSVAVEKLKNSSPN